ncbi:MarR family winged helix-turn-helix transcriptional regulator [Streptomyces pactum]|uniref:MarR family winged helix-turn-helix transcriptional regulator n=1 Tax=Streptomyces pactum TaxID=68249 RepID=UPI0036FFA7A7
MDDASPNGGPVNDAPPGGGPVDDASPDGGPAGAAGAPPAAELLSRTALGTFRLNGQFLAVAEELARPAGLTAARWQVLGAVLREPLPVAGIARAMGITRQSVQRVADLLVAAGLAEYRPNPAHRRAKLLAPTDAGRAAIARITPGHREFAERLREALGGAARFEQVMTDLERLSRALDTLTGGRPEQGRG